MEILRSAFERYRNSSLKASSDLPIDVSRIQALAHLPPEIILLISDFLPSADLICFCLCNKRLYEILWKQMVRLGCIGDKDFQVLIQIERDLPGYFACEVCIILHRFDGSERFSLNNPSKWEMCSGFNHIRKEKICKLPCVRYSKWFYHSHLLRMNQLYDHSLNQLSFLHVKLAMRRFYLGPSSGISTDSLYYTQVTDYNPISTNDHTSDIVSLFSIEAEICPDPLGFYVRMQDIMVTESWNNWLRKDCPLTSQMNRFWLCRHLHLITFITPWMNQRNSDLWEYQEGQCTLCLMDYHVRAFEFDDRPTIIATRWLNLGLGITMNDPSWQLQACHLLAKEREFNVRKDISPRLCFELTTSQSFGELSLRNVLYLRNNQYRLIMKLIPPRKLRCCAGLGRIRPLSDVNTWYIFEEPSTAWNIVEALRSFTDRCAGQTNGYGTNRRTLQLHCNDSPMEFFRYCFWTTPVDAAEP